MNPRLDALICVRAIACALALAATSRAAVAASPPPPHYSVAARWPLGGEGGWDYLTIDATARRLFVTHADHVEVLDLATGHPVGSIADTAGVHGVALARDRNRGYTSNGRANTVTAFALDTLQVIATAPVAGINPDAILYEPRNGRVFTFNGRSSDATVLDAETLKPIATIPLPGKPEFAVSDGAGEVFVNIEREQGQIVAIDGKTLGIRATWDLPGCAEPSGLAFDVAHHRLFSVCDHGVMVVTDSVSGRQVARVPIGNGPDAVAFDPKSGLVFSSNGEDGTLTIVHADDADHYRPVATLATKATARTLALDPVTGRIYLAAADLVAATEPPPPAGRPRRQVAPGSFVILVAQPDQVDR